MILTKFNPTHTHPTEIALHACVHWLESVVGPEDKSGILEEDVTTAPPLGTIWHICSIKLLFSMLYLRKRHVSKERMWVHIAVTLPRLFPQHRGIFSLLMCKLESVTLIGGMGSFGVSVLVCCDGRADWSLTLRSKLDEMPVSFLLEWRGWPHLTKVDGILYSSPQWCFEYADLVLKKHLCVWSMLKKKNDALLIAF